jgi:taurine dioxygenase
MAYVVTPLSSTIGAQIDGIDLTRPFTDEVRSFVYQTLLDWKVVFFRDQDISTEQHLNFGRLFGALEIHPFAKSDETHPELLSIRHDEDHPGGENIWHSDVTWRESPSLGSILHLKKVPSVGGDTLFADMHAAYQALPDDIKETVTGKVARHDFAAFRNRLKLRGVPEQQLVEFDKQYPNPEHPVIRTHPDTGAPSIYVNRAFTRQILGVSNEESDQLLDKLYAQASHPEFQCRFKWQPNSIAFWDNRACQHYAVSDYWPQERVANRVTIVGDRPTFTPSASDQAMNARYRGVVRRIATGKAENNSLALGAQSQK